MDLTEEEIRGIKLVAASRSRSLQNPRAASTDAKDKRDVEISVDNLHDRSSNERNQKELEKDEPRTKKSDNDHFHRKREYETK